MQLFHQVSVSPRPIHAQQNNIISSLKYYNNLDSEVYTLAVSIKIKKKDKTDRNLIKIILLSLPVSDVLSGFHVLIAVLKLPTDSVFFKLCGRLSHILGPKYLMLSKLKLTLLALGILHRQYFLNYSDLAFLLKRYFA